MTRFKLSKAIALCCMLFWLSACTTQRKAQRKIIKYDLRYPDLVSGYCGDKYPPKEFINERIEYLPGTTTVDTLKVYDTLTQKWIEYIYITRRDSIKTTITKQVENTAKIKSLTVKTIRSEVNSIFYKRLSLGLAIVLFLLVAFRLKTRLIKIA